MSSERNRVRENLRFINAYLLIFPFTESTQPFKIDL
jgi:hypothetical protein